MSTSVCASLTRRATRDGRASARGGSGDGARRRRKPLCAFTRQRRRRTAGEERLCATTSRDEDTKNEPSTSTSERSLRSIFDAVRGSVLTPTREASDGFGASETLTTTTTTTEDNGRTKAAAIVDAVANLASVISGSFDEAFESPQDKVLAERKKRARMLTAERRKRRQDVKTREELNAMRPGIEVMKLENKAVRDEIGLDCDEMHFVPVGDASGWSVALLRYRADPRVEAKRSVVMVPGCASNGMTFDVDPSVSLPRYLTRRGHEVWIVETRGVGYARRWTRPRSEYVSKMKLEADGELCDVPMMRSVGFGLWDYDTLLNEDLFCACEYIAEVGKKGDLAGIGHSMGGMLLASLAAIGPKASDIGETSSWSITRVCTMASCLECSEESDPESPTSVYARFAALAGHLPRGLVGNPSTTTVHLPIAPASVATAEAFQFVLGPPPPIDGGENAKPDPAKAFWRNSVSPVTCHPGATDSEFLKRLLLRGFNNVPLSLLIQMATLFTPGGMSSRDPTMGVDETSSVRARLTRNVDRLKYIDELARASVPVLAIAGDVDPIFPPNQVRAYARKVGAEYHVYGEFDAKPKDDPDAHFSHYDVICGRRAPKLVFPVVGNFVGAHDD